jgi:polyhydroxyalkanoate synthase
MSGLLIGLGVAGGLLLLVCLYWVVIRSMYPEKLRTNEVHTVVTHDLWKLRMCRYRKGRTEGEPILFVHGFNANQHNFTAPPGGCLVDYLVEKGHDCWAIDLRGNRSSQPPFEHFRSDATIDDIVRYDIPAAIYYIRKQTGYGKVHWIGHSMGGMLLYAYDLYAGHDYISCGVTLGAPIGFANTRDTVPGFVTKFAKTCPIFAGNLLRAFVPIAMLLRLGTRLFPINLRNLATGLHAGHFFTMLDTPPPRILEEIAFWQKHHVWRMFEDTLDVAAGLKDLRVPLLAFYGPLDPFVDLESAQAFIDQLPHKDKQIIVLSKANGCACDYSHCDLAFGKEGAKEVFEPAAKWLAAHPIHERINLNREYEGTPDSFRPPLKHEERVGILSGESFAHVTESDTESGAAQEPVKVVKKPVPVRRRAAAPVKIRAARPAAKATAAKKPKPAKPASKKAPAKKPAAKKPTAKKRPVRKKPALGLEPMAPRTRKR